MMTLDDTKGNDPSPAPPQEKKISYLQDGAKDPWSDWQPSWTQPRGKAESAVRITPQDHQEGRAPTKTVTTQTEKDGDIHTSRRRIIDARLWEAMTPVQQDAAICIALAAESMGKGLGFAASDWQRIRGSGTGNTSEAQARLIGIYFDWAQSCQKSKISHAMIFDILVLGKSCRHVDRERRIRAGSARANLMEGLSLYCKIRGWR